MIGSCQAETEISLDLSEQSPSARVLEVLDYPRSLWKANFVCIIEDMPCPENRVVIDDNKGDGVLIKYTIRKELRAGLARFRELLAERLKDRRKIDRILAGNPS